MEPIYFINRKTGEKVAESVMGNGALSFAYETLLGRTLWPVLFGSKLVSSILGAYYDSRASRKAIATLANIPGCESREAEKPIEEYESFNEFFTRHLKPGSRQIGENFVSPADGRLMLYRDANLDAAFPLKGATRTLRDVIGTKLATELKNEKYDIAVVRLAPVDYHRFHFPYDCTTREHVAIIKGKYHSVNPIALVRYPNVYADNERQILACDASFGRFYMIDVGAFGVGTIVQTFSGEEHKKGEEKGYFKFGGSTVIIVAKAGSLIFDEDIVANATSGYETRVFCGESIARARN